MAQPRPQCLLVVEDEALVRMLLETVLEDTDYTFRLVSSSGSAMAALEAEGGRFDALVTNVNLGEGPDGFEIARRAREVNPGIHVIYMSGDAAHRFESEKVPNGEFLPKPFDPNDLLSALHRRLGRSVLGELPPGQERRV